MHNRILLSLREKHSGNETEQKTVFQIQNVAETTEKSFDFKCLLYSNSKSNRVYKILLTKAETKEIF